MAPGSQEQEQSQRVFLNFKKYLSKMSTNRKKKAGKFRTIGSFPRAEFPHDWIISASGNYFRGAVIFIKKSTSARFPLMIYGPFPRAENWQA